MAGRKQLDFQPQPAPYCVAETKNLPPEIATVIVNHYWTWKESKESSYIDLLDMLEIIQVDNENRRRDFQYYDSVRRQTNG